MSLPLVIAVVPEGLSLGGMVAFAFSTTRMTAENFHVCINSLFLRDGGERLRCLRLQGGLSSSRERASPGAGTVPRTR